ncbi:MAG: sugar-binding protein [Chthoniobacteraceae bacterium]
MEGNAEPPVSGVDFQSTVVTKDDKNVWIVRDKTPIGMARGNAEITLEGTSPVLLKVDASAAAPDASGKELELVRFFVPLGGVDYSAKKLTAHFKVTADRPARGKVYIEGMAAGKHFYKAQEVQIGDQPAELCFSTRSVDAMEKVWVRFDAYSPAVYRISGADLQVAPENEVDAGKNWIVNGGAEQGWYGIGMTSMEQKGMGGKIYTNKECIITEYGTWTLDRSVFHGGRTSFKSDGAVGRLFFNPVPYVPGRPACFSVWMKAQKPGAKVDLSFFLGSGIAYIKSVTVSAEWRKYEVQIPNWGEPAPGITRLGNVVSGEASVFEKVSPIIDASGVVWVDDASYSVAEVSTFRDDSTLWLRGKLDKATHNYRCSEPVTAEVQIENPTSQPRQVTLSFTSTDFFGRQVGSGEIGTFTIAPGEIKPVQVPVKWTLLGPGNVAVIARDQTTGSQYRHVFYLGRTDSPGPKLDRMGLDCRTQQNMEALVPYLDEFRIGSVRLWSDYKEAQGRFLGVENVPILKKAGLYTLVSVGFDQPLLLAARDLQPWQAFLKRNFAPVAGLIDCYEILNEPNIWGGKSKNPDPLKYEEMSPEAYVRTLHAAAEAIRGIDPQSKFGGPTTCHTDVSFTGHVLALGAGKYLDLVTEHPYRLLPELPDYETDLVDLRRTLRTEGGRELPMAASECGFNNTAMLVDDEIEETMRHSAELSIRNMLIGFANGTERYIQFQSSLWPEGTGWHVFLAGNPDNECKAIPNPVLYAMRALADRLGAARVAGRIKVGADCRCYVFERGDSRIVCLWKWNGKPLVLNLKSAVEDGIVYDLMGNPMEATAATVGEAPLYIETSLSFDALQKAVSGLDFGNGEQSLTANVKVLDTHRFVMDVTNRTSTPVSGVVEMFGPNGDPVQKQPFQQLGAEESVPLTFDAPQPIGTRDQSVAIRITTAGSQRSQTHDYHLRAMLCPAVSKPLTIDGDLSDWPSQDPVVLSGPNAVKRDPRLWTDADKAIRAEVRTAWDDNYLYVAVAVVKNGFHPNAPSASSLYNGDSLQIAFDPLKNASIDKKSYDDDDFEYCLGLFEGAPCVYRICASSSVYDSLQKSLGVLNGNEVKLAVKPLPGKTVYEMAFSRAAISPLRLAAGNSMRWDILANLNNGKSRMGWLELTPGIGASKYPAAFMDLFLVK